MAALNARNSVLRSQSLARDVAKAEPTNLLVAALSLCIVISSVVIGFIIWKDKFSNVKPNVTPVAAKSDVPASVTAWANHVNDQLKNIHKKQAITDYHVWLLSLVSNENANLNQNINRMQRVPDAPYLYLEGDWKLNKTPETIQLDDLNKEMMQKSLK